MKTSKSNENWFVGVFLGITKGLPIFLGIPI